jgi:2-polyprenyl-3-methyl-5-hydroxy-6-metoxy-1,4-benzoquinol methylase
MDTAKQQNVSALDAEAYDEQWAVIDDFIAHNPGARHRRRIAFSLIHSVAPQTILDVGCGNGELLMSMKETFPYATFSGVDISPHVIKKNASRFQDITFDVLNLELQSLSSQFDLVVCSEVIEHLNDRPKALENLASMVKPGGHLLLTAPTGKIYATERRWGHTTHPTVSELKAFAKRSNLNIRHLSNWGFPFYSGLKAVTNINPEWSLKEFGNGAYSHNKKLLCKFLYFVNFANLNNSPWGCQLFALLQKP